MLTQPATGGQIQGYDSATSAAPGSTVTYYVSTTAPSFRADVYRMGWYDGKGGLLMLSRTALTGVHQPPRTTPDPATGLTWADWQPSFSITVARTWPSGMYMTKLTTSTGYQAYVPLVVLGSGKAPILLVHASATEEAYNTWGSQSLYQGTTPALHLGRAVEVSFDRPFVRDFGAGEFFYWEYQMVRFLERNGYRVDYATDIDIAEHPEWLKRYRAVLIVGHDEYWTLSMRDGYLAAVAAGVSLGVFAGNTAYRQIRLEPSRLGPDRIQICYKEASLDPLYGRNNAVVTAFSWRDAPTDWDESRLLGAMYVSTGNIHHLPWVVQDPSSWVLAGTGLARGQSLPGLVGYEEDMYYPNLPHPAGLVVLSSSPVKTSKGVLDSNSTLYTAPSGARVFNAGTVEWSWGLDDFVTPTIERGLRTGGFVEDTRPDYRSPAAEIITRNILNDFLAGSPSPAATASPSP